MPSNLVISALVTRASLSLSPLQLEDPGTYRVVSTGPGQRTWRRTVAQSAYVHGETLIVAVLEHGSAPLHIRVYGSTLTEVDARAAVIVAAFSQFTYQLQLTIDGRLETWNCEPADISPFGGSGEHDPNRLRARMQEYRLIIPREPIPVSGAV